MNEYNQNIESPNDAKTLLLAVGNTLRSDDGAGWVVAQLVEQKKIDTFKVMYTHQLQTEWLEHWVQYSKVIITDADVNAQTVTLLQLTGLETKNKAMSHHTDAGLMLALCQKLYGKSPDVWLCSIPAYIFEHGEGLSPQTAAHASKAVCILLDFLQ